MKRLLVANRGEIALRVIRACREEGISPVAVYSEADRNSPHVGAADHAVCIGPAPASESYLSIERLLAAADAAGADAVHPGYGFLAERPAFARAVSDAGLTFVGPSADAISAMGEKTEARRRMDDAGVPVVPGTLEPVSDAAEVSEIAREIGFPILLKAVAGGGGRGMRVVRASSELDTALSQARSEALKAFGDGAVYVEKLVEGPRHVEIQVLADTHGTVVHLGERECSVQRRHQKLIEEAPSPAVDGALREQMGGAAVRAAQAVNYVGAGTVEFLLAADGSFFFLEMNTRIQVEHPVTELVYGIDLVREQLRVARGERIEVRGEAAPRGHALECRITSEDPFNDFLPNTGVVTSLHIPSGPGVRWDGGIDVGSQVGLHYDSLLGKLIAWGETRDVALARMRRALGEFSVSGVATCQSFHTRVLQEEVFCSGQYTIEYFDTTARDLLATEPSPAWCERVAAAMALLAERERTSLRALSGSAAATDSRWLRDARNRALR